jgi:hypothetical protein
MTGSSLSVRAGTGNFSEAASWQITNLRSEPGLIVGERTFQLDRFPGLVDRLTPFLRDATPEDHQVIELTLSQPKHPTMTLGSHLRAVASTRPFYDEHIHPPGSTVWRYFSLPVLLAVIASVARRDPIAFEVVEGSCTLREVRDLLARPTPARPLALGPPTATFEAHAGVLDAYQMAMHDLSHLAVMNAAPLDRPAECVRLFDALDAAFSESELGRTRPDVAHDLLDHVLSGYAPATETTAYLETHLATFPPDGDVVFRRFCRALQNE